MKHASLRGVASFALLATTLSAQGFLSPGLPVLTGDDRTTTVTLHAPFPFPDGTLVTDIDLDTNGRVFPAGTDTSDFSESISELLGGPTSICPFWDDHVADGLGAVYFNSQPGIDVITWLEVRQFGGSATYTFQLQLLAGGSMIFLYDSRTPADEPLTGASAGIGNPDPGSSDFSLGPIATMGVPDLYEDFDIAPFDLISSALVLTPDTMGGYATNVVTGVQDPVFTFADITSGGPGCPRFAVTSMPVGGGSYAVFEGGSFDYGFLNGTPLGLSDDGRSGSLALGFNFTFPNGFVTPDIEVFSNGRIGSGATAINPDFTPTLNEFLGANDAMIAPFWTDLNPSAGGEIYFATAPGEASVTWVDVPQFRGDQGHTFQLRLFADNSFQFVYAATPHNMAPATLRDLIIGFTVGLGTPDPGETDLTAGLPFVTIGGDFYEFFDNLGAGELEDIPDDGATLEVSGAPTVGGTLDVEVRDLDPTALTVTLLIGAPTVVDLTSLNVTPIGCHLLTSGEISGPLPHTGSTTGVQSFNIPNMPSLAGLTAAVQAVVFESVVPPITTTDMFNVTVGS